uniref:Uncharacterized protein n=1 Tax=Mucochytrium quahogii TaxID=96639 RepID=A0A7S2RHJ9_9STRA|mmetsp:Transcript_6236/g.9857  ORF Transcript_6236/g.9857 Transcript_6236/m.9857 type:complete len:344 (+) Transcript_6236:213-1244(+)|eukprot:CAMPEP_0203756984 /NCGR_PEP_ID=MMETSP0098-20131031/10157_1 /ASSEMBLY_ACC=CAM_ASM_000208 /TAXON_ID=96639 /ORGANISM=" , Strain NY0313808BC1" /LENGTH=343 /DNA_ID=CAMNT_0050649061 /DNA_START=201 /DNA_END=1232 /DNA_ORIENTATION=-
MESGGDRSDLNDLLLADGSTDEMDRSSQSFTAEGTIVVSSQGEGSYDEDDTLRTILIKPHCSRESRASSGRRVTFVGVGNVDRESRYRIRDRPSYPVNWHAHARKGHFSKTSACILKSCLVFFALVLAGLSVVWLCMLGVFTGAEDWELPTLTNATARDRKTGALFVRKLIPPGENETYELLGLSVHRLKHWDSFVSGFYVREKSLQIDKWKELNEAGNLTVFYNDLLSTSLGMRMSFVLDSNGTALSTSWLESLDRRYPKHEAAIKHFSSVFRGWIPSIVFKNATLWVTYSQHGTRLVLENNTRGSLGEIRPLEIPATFGEAFFLSELVKHGKVLTSLLYNL